MIPMIGLLVAAYTFTRLLNMACDKNVCQFVKVVAVLAMFVTVVCALGLISSGASSSY